MDQLNRDNWDKNKGFQHNVFQEALKRAHAISIPPEKPEKKENNEDQKS